MGDMGNDRGGGGSSRVWPWDNVHTAVPTNAIKTLDFFQNMNIYKLSFYCRTE